MKTLSRLLLIGVILSASVACSHSTKNPGSQTAPLASHPALNSVGTSRVPSENPKIENFHRVELSDSGNAVYRSADPFRKFMSALEADLAPKHLEEQASVIMKDLKTRYGVRTIISMKEPHESSLHDWSYRASQLESTLARKLGIRLIQLPVSDLQLSKWNQQEIATYLASVDSSIKQARRKGAVLIHCTGGTNRVGLAAAFLRIKYAGLDVQRAIDEMRDLGHNWARYPAANQDRSVHESFLIQQFAKGNK